MTKMRLHVPAAPFERFRPDCLESQVGRVVRFEDDESEACPCYAKVIHYQVAKDGTYLTIDVEEVEGP